MLFWHTEQLFAKWSAKAGVARGPGAVSSLESMIRSKDSTLWNPQSQLSNRGLSAS